MSAIRRSRFSVTRRGALLGAAAIGASGAAQRLGMPFIRNVAAAEPIRIGLLLAKTGQIAPQTEYLANGSYLALAEHQTVLGRPVEMVWFDEPTPQGAQQNMQKLVQEQKVVAILGGALSSNALAEEAAAAQLKVPLVIDNAAATEITGKKCNRYTFRLNPPVQVQARLLAPFIMGYGKKWYYHTASYTFGQDINRSFQQILTRRPAALSWATTRCR